MLKKFIFLILIISLILPGNLLPQSQKLTIKDAVWEIYFSLKPQDLSNICWRNNDQFTYIKNDTVFIYDLKTFTENILITTDDLNKLIQPYSNTIFNRIKNFKWINETECCLERHNKYFFIDIDKNKLTDIIELPDEAENIEICKQTGNIAYTLSNNLYYKTRKSKEIAISDEGYEQIVFGQAVHRHEFGIEKGIFWSPKGNYIAFYRKDESMVADYPLVTFNSEIAQLKNIKYPMAGKASHEVTIGIYSLTSKKTIYLNTGKPKDHYLTNICWSPDENNLYVAVLNREQNQLKYNKYDIKNGEFLNTLFKEQNEKYIEPMNPACFLKNSNEKFLWQSRSDGYNHIYLYNVEGNLIKQLTKGTWEVVELLGANEECVFFRATKESPIEQNIYKVNIETNNITKLSIEPGIHEAISNSNFSYIIDRFSNLNTTNKINIIKTSSIYSKNILESPDPFINFNLPDVEISSIKINDSIELYYRLIKPKEIDNSKKYPVIIYVYGGPHLQLIDNSWLGGASLWDFYMAQEGYILFSLDNRGSSNRGFDFESEVFRKLGQLEMKDQMEGVKFLKSLPYVDTNKIGVYGWSFGGFMSTSLMVNYPNVFKVGVAGGPVISWNYYEVMYTERYMDTPEENLDGYQLTNLNNYAENLNGKLLIIQGAQDPVVVWQNSLTFLNSCIKAGKQVDYFVYPNHEHNVRGYDRIHLMEKITQYFNDYLK